MQRALVTGLNGRLAPYLQQALEQANVEVISFDRQQLDITHRPQQIAYIRAHKIDAIFHLATGSEDWLSILADIADELTIPMVFTSTESVFNPDSKGPFTPEHPADAVNEYGRYKISCEHAALAANPNIIVARLGWQMFDTFEQDNLLTHVRDMHNEKGYLEASTEWLPAVAYVEHSMQCLIRLAKQAKAGIYHIGGNELGLSFYQLVELIKQKYQLDWDVRPAKVPQRDGRIIDSRVACDSITQQLQR
ncbi:sugar nucleotide-binding protein [Agarivorans sp. TSD2052]|uniref:sugar nucleotide-binding protein n=1 Tax=Agarivorans sp. TSD2052 TaxID=2937286 RepID=UPI0020106FDD|nr:sugar nucleotide-binding protein [Agarivorans sp. TSD2052]UPW19662.1 sugar nucleotide-binding protein [Agarivorans sp. TSD2052]